MAGKGDPLPHRPHRRAHSVFQPEAGTVTDAQLRALVALAPAPEPRVPSGNGQPSPIGAGTAYDVAALLTAAGITAQEREKGYARVYELDRCLTSDDHTDGAAILQFPSGAVTYTCRHNRCLGSAGRTSRRSSGSRPRRTGATRGCPFFTHNRGAWSCKHLPMLPHGLSTGSGSGGSRVASSTSWAGTRATGSPRSPRHWRPLALVGERGRMDHSAPLIRTLFVLGEDSAEDTLRPRLELHDADMDQIFVLKTVLDEEGRERFFNVSKHLDLLEETIIEHEIDLIVIDPLTTVMAGTDRNAEGDTRDTLTPLAKLAERRGVAVIGIAHVGKSGDGRRAAQKILGATAFHAMARVVWMVAPDEDERWCSAS